MQNQIHSFPVTGMGVITPAGNDINSLWQRCLTKESFIQNGLGRIDKNAANKLWQSVANSRWIKKIPTLLSKSFIFSIYTIIQAVEAAEWKNFTEDDVIFIGTTTAQISLWENELIQHLKVDGDHIVDEAKLAKQPFQTLADDLKLALNFPGRIFIIASACSASTQAIIAAHNYLSMNRASRCITGGVEELSDLTIAGFNCLKLLSTDQCKPFDQSRVGINLSEGSAFYTIEKTSNVKPLAYLYGGETVLDSYHMTSPSVEGIGLQKALTNSLKKSHLSPSDISIIHCHGTGSIQNDNAESFAIDNIFKNRPPVISTKGIHGHALGASGAIEFGISIKILNENKIPPIAGLVNVDENIKLNLPREVLSQDINFLIKTTLGFGGINSTFIIGKVPHA